MPTVVYWASTLARRFTHTSIPALMSAKVSAALPLRAIFYGSDCRSVWLPIISGLGRSKSGISFLSRGRTLRLSISRRSRRELTAAMTSGLPGSLFVHDMCMAALTSGAALGLLKFWEELAKRRFFEEVNNAESQASYLAALAPGVNIFRMILLGLGIWKNEALVKSMSRSGDHRELLKGPLYYAATLTLATAVFWRTSPIAISAICNLCAGDGVADIVGRRFGRIKLPYNPNKSVIGSIAMASAGFIASVMYMHYLSLFGFIEESWRLVLSFLVVSIASAFVESLPISTDLDDNLTVTLTSVFLGSFVL